MAAPHFDEHSHSQRCHLQPYSSFIHPSFANRTQDQRLWQAPSVKRNRNDQLGLDTKDKKGNLLTAKAPNRSKSPFKFMKLSREQSPPPTSTQAKNAKNAKSGKDQAVPKKVCKI